MYKTANARLSQRIAEEAQLLAEEKWIIETLKKSKEHRNSLQIERLHLENLKAQLKKGKGSDTRSQAPSTVTSETCNEVTAKPSVSTMNIRQILVNRVQEGPESSTIPVTSMLEFDVPMAGIDDEMCNNEELNLAVTNSVFTSQDSNALDIEEEEEDMENCVIDMNMFMYGQ